MNYQPGSSSKIIMESVVNGKEYPPVPENRNYDSHREAISELKRPNIDRNIDIKTRVSTLENTVLYQAVYMYTYVLMYVHQCIYIYVSIYTCIYIHTSIYIHTYICIYVFLYIGN
jgi:hypothetical protein